MSDTPVCPCDTFTHPRPVVNPPGRDRVAYRVGDFVAFRRALLLAVADPDLPAETELGHWRPGAAGDLAVQVAEWWAYLAHVLAFYNERTVNQFYLRTADQPESVRRLIRLLGYRPRPGVGARGVVAALLSGPAAGTVPRGFEIQSKPGPGKQPQTFEVDEERTVSPAGGQGGGLSAAAAASTALFRADGSVLLKGAVNTVKVGDRLLLLKKGWSGDADGYALVTVAEVTPEKDPRGKPNTRVKLSAAGLPAASKATDFRLLRSTQTAHPWQFPTGDIDVIDETQVDLDALTRQAKVGDPVLFDVAGASSAAAVTTKSATLKKSSKAAGPALTVTSAGKTGVSPIDKFRPGPTLVQVTGYTEVLWYTNPDKPKSDPNVQPANPPTTPIPILHSRLGVQPALTGFWNAWLDQVTVHYAWQDVGELTVTAATTVKSAGTTLSPPAGTTFPQPQNGQALVEDATGQGAAAVVDSPTSLRLTDPVPTLTPPLQAFFNLLPVSRGRTVTDEVLGRGDASQPGQEFVLQKSPLTYLLSGDTSAGGSYKSTLRVLVDGIEWQEVPSFYDQPPDARVFVTREDDLQKTHVLTGNGVNGARLASGAVVVARYRYESGADAPAAGSLTVVTRPLPGLAGVRNPVVVGGGADPEPPAQIRRYAPRSVLTFGRAVSADGYETVAAQAPGVARARAAWGWDADEQRALVKVYVGDDAPAVAAAVVALTGAADPNRPFLVQQATAVPISLSLSVELAPRYDAPPVVKAVRAALLDAEAGLFGASAVRIGGSVFTSHIHAACLKVDGTRAVHTLRFYLGSGTARVADDGYRHDPGEGKFFRLTDDNLEVSAHASA